MIASTFDLQDAIALAGMVMIGIGFALFWLPGTFIVPGAVLLYIALFMAPKE